MPDLIATKRIPYAGKMRDPGDRFEAKDKDARLLIAIGKAELAPAGDDPLEQGTKEMVAEESATTPSGRKRVYRRRDIATAPETK